MHAFSPTSKTVRSATRRGFTLIEILVVIGIIVVLMGILIPAIAGVRERGYHAKTTALLAGLANNIETYFTTFDAYPGPIPATGSGPTTTGVGGTTKISGTQSLLIALSYSMWSPEPTGSAKPSGYSSVQLSPSNVYVDVGNLAGPRDLSQSPAKAYSPFFNPNPSEIGPPAGTSGGNTTLNTIYDSWPDALPILYYRRTPGTEGSIVYDANFAATSQTIVGEDPTTVRAYYRAENSEYTDSNSLKSLSGRVYDQTNSGFNGNSSASHQYLAEAIVGRGANQTINARGGFVLISAGSDRVYGANKDKALKNDDIINVGGH